MSTAPEAPVVGGHPIGHPHGASRRQDIAARHGGSILQPIRKLSDKHGDSQTRFPGLAFCASFRLQERYVLQHASFGSGRAR